MLISFLLPTRDRLPYLKLAIETVRRQDLGDWEIVVSDNASQEDVPAYINSLEDSRIVVRRAPQPISVTENWNAALEMSSGDYVLMLGDDDGLLPGYVSHMSRLIDAFDRPDLIYTGSLLFTYPGVDPAAPRGSLAGNSHAEFFGRAREAFLIGREDALRSVRRSLRFHLAFNFNMQLSLVSRRLIERTRDRGAFFQSPFPDFYASCAAMLRAERVVAEPREMVVVGVTPRSYGFFHLNQRETEGRAFLGGSVDGGAQLPGTNINEGWLGAMNTLAANYGAEFGLRVSLRRYRLLQASNVYTRELHGAADAAEVARLEATLPLGERLLARGANRLARLVRRALPTRTWTRLTQRVLRQHPLDWDPWRQEGGYADLLEVTERIAPRTA